MGIIDDKLIDKVINILRGGATESVSLLTVKHLNCRRRSKEAALDLGTKIDILNLRH